MRRLRKLSIRRDNEDILFEFDGSNNILAKYVHGPGIDEPLIMQRGGNNFYYHADGLGTIMELTDSSGAVAQSYVYDAFGQIITQGSGLVNPYTFTGREFDGENNLYYYRARYYDPTIGRFLQEDPVKGNKFYSQSFNPFTYVQNNPINSTDPTGLQAPISLITVAPPQLPAPTLPGTCPLPSPNLNNPIVSSPIFNFPGDDKPFEQECTLVDRGPTVCQYKCPDGTFRNIRNPNPGFPESCPPVVPFRG